MIPIDKRKYCPNGGYVSYPIGTIKKIKMGDYNCKECPFYKLTDSDNKEFCDYK